MITALGALLAIATCPSRSSCHILTQQAGAMKAKPITACSKPRRFDSSVSTTSTSTALSSASFATDPASVDSAETVTILGFGSLLSERSSRLTFPTLRNFRLGRVPDHRRVFCHPAAIFFERKIANLDTLEISSLSAEFCKGSSFVCSVFEVPADELMEDLGETARCVPSREFLEREEEFDIATVEYEESIEGTPLENLVRREGILCRRSTDEAYKKRWGPERLPMKYGQYGIDTIWGWDVDSGIRPCGAYLRHCVLAATKLGNTCLDSFLDDTFLVDRKTTIRAYLERYPEVMETVPPGDLAVRYGG